MLQDSHRNLLLRSCMRVLILLFSICAVDINDTLNCVIDKNMELQRGKSYIETRDCGGA